LVFGGVAGGAFWIAVFVVGERREGEAMMTFLHFSFFMVGSAFWFCIFLFLLLLVGWFL
jgi:hypothetical protein